MKDSTQKWLSVHIFYAGNLDLLLSKGIIPFIEKNKKDQRIEQFFFIRYGEGGPHIRLRLQCKMALAETELKQRVQSHFTLFFQQYPVVLSTLGDELINEIRFVPYEAEVERYGGSESIALVESQFAISSQLSLEMIQAFGEGWNYEAAIGQSLKLQNLLIGAVGFSREEAAVFFDFFFYNWLPHSIASIAGVQSIDESTEKQAIDAFETSFQEQSAQLIPFHQLVWNSIESKSTFSEPWLNEWMRFHQRFDRQLSTVLELPGRNPRPADYELRGDLAAYDPIDQERWMIYADLIHMTNNRLGILNKDEGYIAYLIKESIKRQEKV